MYEVGKKKGSNLSFFSKCKNPSNTSGMSEGPTKNLFNCCDRPVNEQDIELLEPHYYRDWMNHNNYISYLKS